MALHRRDLLALSGTILAGCLGDSDGPDAGTVAGVDPDASDRRVEPDVPAGDVAELARGNTAFAFELHERLVAAEPDADHFVSPFGVSAALAMAYAGARGETAERMADALEFPFRGGDLHAAFNALGRELEPREEGSEDDGEGGDPFELAVANALWPREGLDVREPFRDTLAAHYGARPVELDFEADPEGASEAINAWVAGATGGRIEDLVSTDAVRGAALVLTNAVYFLAGWQNQFDAGTTSEAAFAALDGSTGEVSLMSQAERFPYAEVDGHQVIELPYVGGKTSMVVMLPAAGGFRQFEAGLDADRLAGLLAELDDRRGRIEVPRFELGTEYSLPRRLRELGMELPFTEGADFGGMVEDTDVLIDDVVHEAFVAVDEEGAEAAAATGVSVEPVSEPPPEQFEMTVDRPFLFAIRDRPTGSVLFLGRVVDVPEDP